MNIDKFLKDIVKGNIKSVKYYKSRDEAREKGEDTDGHEYHNDFIIDDNRSFIVVTLKNDKKYYVVAQSCSCCSTTFGIEKYKDKSKCYCSKEKK